MAGSWDNWEKFNSAEFRIGDKVYRNIEDEVLHLKELVESLDVEELLSLIPRVETLEKDVDDLTDYTEALGDDIAEVGTKLDARTPRYKGFTLWQANWTEDEDEDDYKYELSVQGMDLLQESLVIVSPQPRSYDLYGESLIRCTAQADGILVFRAPELPADTVFVNVVVINGRAVA